MWIDINECEEQGFVCDSSQKCENTVGSYKCTCAQGYYRDPVTAACIGMSLTKGLSGYTTFLHLHASSNSLAIYLYRYQRVSNGPTQLLSLPKMRQLPRVIPVHSNHRLWDRLHIERTDWAVWRWWRVQLWTPPLWPTRTPVVLQESSGLFPMWASGGHPVSSWSGSCTQWSMSTPMLSGLQV